MLYRLGEGASVGDGLWKGACDALSLSCLKAQTQFERAPLDTTPCKRGRDVTGKCCKAREEAVGAESGGEAQAEVQPQRGRCRLEGQNVVASRHGCQDLAEPRAELAAQLLLVEPC